MASGKASDVSDFCEEPGGEQGIRIEAKLVRSERTQRLAICQGSGKHESHHKPYYLMVGMCSQAVTLDTIIYTERTEL